MNSKFVCVLALALTSTAVFAGITNYTYTITDANSSATINTADGTGMSGWEVDGVNQLNTQWFWYRVGGTGPEYQLGSLDLLTATLSNTNPINPMFPGFGDNDFETLFLKYGNDDFNISIRYSLQGGTAGSGVADIAEQIVINNTTDASMDFSFFQYSDFDLGGTPGGDSVSLIDGGWVQTGDNVSFSETVNTLGATLGEASIFDSTVAGLNDGATTTLNGSTSAGPGNVTWAWQWDLTIAGISAGLPEGGSVTISKDKNFIAVPIPAPGAFVLGAMGLGLVGWVRRRYS